MSEDCHISGTGDLDHRDFTEQSIESEFSAEDQREYELWLDERAAEWEREHEEF